MKPAIVAISTNFHEAGKITGAVEPSGCRIGKWDRMEVASAVRLMNENGRKSEVQLGLDWKAPDHEEQAWGAAVEGWKKTR